MDFSNYRHGDVVPGMTVADLPFDARIFVLRSDPLYLGASNATLHWEYRQHRTAGKHMWQIWPGASDYYEGHGERVEPHVADYMIRSGSAVYDPDLQLPEGL